MDHSEHREKGAINVASFNALKQRMIEIGAQDLDDPEPEAKAAARPKKSVEELLARPLRPARQARKARQRGSGLMDDVNGRAS